jgi:hypothetical protein
VAQGSRTKTPMAAAGRRRLLEVFLLVIATLASGAVVPTDAYAAPKVPVQSAVNGALRT